jgi:hypothetical protein
VENLHGKSCGKIGGEFCGRFAENPFSFWQLNRIRSMENLLENLVVENLSGKLGKSGTHGKFADGWKIWKIRDKIAVL